MKYLTLIITTSLGKFCALVIISHDMRFIYYSNIKLTEILQFDMLILYKCNMPDMYNKL